MRSRFVIPQPLAETGLAKTEKRAFNMLLRVVQQLIPKQDAGEQVDVTSLGTVRRNSGGSTSSSDETREGRWL